jgi:putative acetyltransferase
VRPAYRGLGLGRRLTVRTIAAAREAGYAHMLLDTLADMMIALELYRTLGFVEAPPYRHNPLPGAKFLQLDLAQFEPPRG